MKIIHQFKFKGVNFDIEDYTKEKDEAGNELGTYLIKVS